MAAEIKVQSPTGRTLYAVVLDAAGQVWDTDAEEFVAIADAGWADYAIPLVEQDGTGIYYGDAPGSGVYDVVVYRQLGGAPATTDSLVGSGPIGEDKTGYKLAADGADLVLVDGKTLPVAVAIIAALAAGKVSGAGTGTEVFVGLDGVTVRATVTVDNLGNRSQVSYG